MELDFSRLPRKSYRNEVHINKILETAEDLLYTIIQIDYNTGMIRFESVMNPVRINVYCTTLSITVELVNSNRKNNQFHFKKCSLSEIIKLFNNPLTK